ncbi:MAG: hypothetical protein AAGC55_34255, partial [Myxococcota bacterium]
TVDDRTRATRIGHSALIAPGLDMLERWRGRGAVRASGLRAVRDTSPDSLVAAAAGQRPTVLFTMSHGQGAPAGGWMSDEEQRREQGAMSFGAGGQLAGHDLAGRAFLPGGVWFMFACFGAGTPVSSAYRHWLELLVRGGQESPEVLETAVDSLAVGGAPFIAALPKAALASPDGPLAFVGHVDLAWSCSYLDVDDPDGRPRRRPGRFMSAVQAVLDGARFGNGLSALSRFLTEVDTELAALSDREQAGYGQVSDRAVRRGHLWMTRHDLAAYVLLGDPAARLPVARRASAASERAALSQRAGAGPAPGAGQSAPVDPALLARQEKAIGKVLSRQFTVARAARDE